MKSEGLFDIISQIKFSYGQDIAIISCEELNKNNCGHYKELVTAYIPMTKHSDINANQLKDPSDILKPNQKIYNEIIKSEIKNNIRDILKNRKTPEELESLANIIIENYISQKSSIRN